MFKEQRLQLFVTIAIIAYATQMNEHDYLDYGHASFNEYILDVYLRAQDSTVC